MSVGDPSCPRCGSLVHSMCVGVRDVEQVVGFDPRDAEIVRLRAEAERRSDAQLIRRLGACCGVLEQERDAALARAEKAEAEVARLTAERRADELAVKLDGAIVVRDDDETRDRIAQALMTRAAWSPETLSELVNSNQSCLQLAAMRLRADADAVLAALREAYQRGEQDSRGNPMPCLHLDSIEERQNATDAAQEGGAK